MRILQREIRGGNRHFAQIDATTRIAAKVFVVIRKNTLHYLVTVGGAIYEKKIQEKEVSFRNIFCFPYCCNDSRCIFHTVGDEA